MRLYYSCSMYGGIRRLKGVGVFFIRTERYFSASLTNLCTSLQIKNKSKSCQKRSMSVAENNSNEDSKRLVKIALAGNAVITCAKAACWLSTGSSAMLSETVHSFVDCGNQALLLIGLRGADHAPDNLHQYGYGKSIYFWSLVSALGTFWFGAGVSGWNSVKDILNPALELHSIGWEVWAVLSTSFLVDGFVLNQTVKTLLKKKPKNVSFFKYCLNLRDPTTAAVLMEDSAACTGVVVAGLGIAISQCTHMIVWDSIAGLSVAGIMGALGIYLVRLNQRFLMGQSVDIEITDRIHEIVVSRDGVEGIHSVQSQWIGPNAFSYKAEVEIDGTYLAARLLDRYQKEFVTYISKRNVDGALTSDIDADDDEIRLLLSWYAEDVMRVVEQEVSEIEDQIRSEYPAAQYIEIEPDSSASDSRNVKFIGDSSGSPNNIEYAIDAGRKIDALRKLEIDTIKKMQDIIAVKNKNT